MAKKSTCKKQWLAGHSQTWHFCGRSAHHHGPHWCLHCGLARLSPSEASPQAGEGKD
jgi:hypothetical protein